MSLIDGRKDVPTLLAVALLAGVIAVETATALGAAHVAIAVEDVDVTENETVAAVELELTNNGAEPVDPLITVTSESWWIQNPWDVVEGPDVLAPGETAHYRVEAPGERARPAVGDRVTVMVLDEGTQRRSAIGPAPLRELVERIPLVIQDG